MKKSFGFCFAVVLTASAVINNVQAYERVELDHARTSIEYSGPIEAVAKVIEGYRWLGQTKEMNGGVVFEAYDNQYFGRSDTSLGNAIMVKATFYTYDQVSKEAIMIARQSEIAGFVELYGMESPELQMHIQTLGENEFQAFSSKYDSDKPQKLMTYKKVQQFGKSPYGERLESAEDSGVFH
ncbi:MULTISPECIES: hypothetical protein [Pseudomonas]|uniref:hypothetical protein n=1 Tax=Pseudomonas TaxID=286 RepID=UPI0015FAF082|nr:MULTISPECIES: hypothetical protein [Pseudomonas]MBA6137680.1 hypothetical protein [Pseudomonas monteilii]MDH1695762.1 hypothetical protein [Pseudomonas sp. GD03766]MDT3747224.1 hypothetical protein [Pseudomonas kurunegalensis]